LLFAYGISDFPPISFKYRHIRHEGSREEKPTFSDKKVQQHVRKVHKSTYDTKKKIHVKDTNLFGCNRPYA